MLTPRIVIQHLIIIVVLVNVIYDEKDKREICYYYIVERN